VPKTLPPALAAYLASVQGSADARTPVADGYLFTLQQGTQLPAAAGLQLAYTTVDYPFTLENGVTYSSTGVLVSGLKYKATVGLDADEQTINIAARAIDLVGDLPFLQALRQRVFDGALVERRMAFFSDPLYQNLIGSVVVFKGRVTSIKSLGRVSAQISVKSDLVLLDIDMPRNLWQPTCLHALYGSGCTLNRASFAATGTVGSGSTGQVIDWSGAAATQVQGSFVLADGRWATIKTVNPGVSLTLMVPFQEVPAAGAAFTAYQGCDHTQGTCQSKFSNLLNFRAFPYVPPPEMALF
jgi:uncharacterized phage protein (TIGR02218 family)